MLKCKSYTSDISFSLSLSSDLKFTPVLKYTADPPLESCLPLTVPNEGVLIKALIDHTTVVPLHFYYVARTAPKPNCIPTVTFINSSFLNLTYDTTAYNTTIHTEQDVVIVYNVWALDNISISLQHNGCYQHIY